MAVLNRFEAADAVPIAMATVLTLEHLVYGANRVDLSLLFSVLQATLLAISLSMPTARKSDLSEVHGFWWLAALFCLLLVGIASSMAPLAAENREVWASVGREPISAIDPLGVFIELAKLLGFACLFVLSAKTCVRRRRSQTLMTSLILSGFVFGIVCLILEAISPVFVFNWLKPGIAQGRVSGLFSSANTAATVFGLYALLAAGGFLRAAERAKADTVFGFINYILPSAALEIATFLVSVGCLLLSTSRGGIAAFAPCLALLVIWRTGKNTTTWRKRAALALGIFAVALVFLSGGLAYYRFAHAAVMRDQRVTWAIEAWRLFQQSPLHGFGLGSLPIMFKAQATPETYWTLGWAGAAHNVYLQWLAEGGLMAAIPLLALIVYIVDNSLLGLSEEDPAIGWRRTVLACVLFVCIHSLVEYPLQEPSIAAMFSILLGAGVGFASQRRIHRRRSYFKE